MGHYPGSSERSDLSAPIRRPVIDDDDAVIELDQLRNDGRNHRRLVVGGHYHPDRRFTFTSHWSQPRTPAVSITCDGRFGIKPITRTRQTVFGSAIPAG